MNNWIVLRSFTNQKKCWYVRVSELQQVASFLKLDLSTCECGPVSRIIQEWLDSTLVSSQSFHEL